VVGDVPAELLPLELQAAAIAATLSTPSAEVLRMMSS
jgi:hypothetical protein